MSLRPTRAAASKGREGIRASAQTVQQWKREEKERLAALFADDNGDDNEHAADSSEDEDEDVSEEDDDEEEDGERENDGNRNPLPTRLFSSDLHAPLRLRRRLVQEFRKHRRVVVTRRTVDDLPIRADRDPKHLYLVSLQIVNEGAVGRPPESETPTVTANSSGLR